MKIFKKTIFKPKPLIKQAEKIIEKYLKGVDYDRAFFVANVVLDGKVEIVYEIDGGPILERKVCSTIEEVKNFILKIKFVR